MRIYTKADGKRNSTHLCYAFDQAECSKPQFCSNHEGDREAKTGVEGGAGKPFLARHCWFILGNRNIEKFYVGINYSIP